MFYAFKPDWTSGGPLDICDRKLSTKLQRNLHAITEKSAKPWLYLDKIEGLCAAHPDWPFALVRLGKAYLLLEGLHEALEQFEKVLSLLSPHEDEKFVKYVEDLRVYIKDLEAGEDNEWNKPPDGVIVSPWVAPKDLGHYKFSDVPGLTTIKSTWDTLLSEDNTGVASARYARLLCVETNEIEGVFTLGGESLPRLIKVGFYTGAIDRVRAGGIQEPQKIVAILEDLQNCLNFLTHTVNPSQLSEDIICRIHKMTMKSSRIGVHYDGEDTVFYLTHPGVYRRRLITTSLTSENLVQYTHQSKVPYEMKQFMGLMRACDTPSSFIVSKLCSQKFLERKDISPFAMAAWIHVVFARIHPFTDGNGRVSRLLASLPLIHADYPFINVRVHKREEYLKALFTAQNTPDLQPLMDVLASSMLDSIEYIRSLPPTSPEDQQYQISADLGTTKLSL